MKNETVDYIVTAREWVMTRTWDGRVTDSDANPYRDCDFVYEGSNLEDAKEAAEEYAAENPCEFFACGTDAAVSYIRFDFSKLDENGDYIDFMHESSLTAQDEERLKAYADEIIDAL